MAAAASNKNTSNKEIRIPELEEQAFQYILDSCESSISKYTKFLQVMITTFSILKFVQQILLFWKSWIEN